MENISAIKNYWIEGDNKSNLALLEVAVNGLDSQIELLEKQELEKSKKTTAGDIKEKIDYYNQALIEEYEYYERSKTKNLPYWFRTLSVDRIREYEKKINKYNFTLKILQGIKKGLSPEAILAAKSYPMEDLIILNKNNFALCPFHKEKTPSFKVFADNCWKCFGCGERGDTLDFIQKEKNINFEKAVNYLLGKN